MKQVDHSRGCSIAADLDLQKHGILNGTPKERHSLILLHLQK